jgi:hypothetical protein
LPCLEDRDGIRMTRLGNRLGFLHQTGTSLRALAAFINHLDGDLSIQERVKSPVCRPHAPLPEFVLNLIAIIDPCAKPFASPIMRDRVNNLVVKCCIDFLG